MVLTEACSAVIVEQSKKFLKDQLLALVLLHAPFRSIHCFAI